MPTPRRRPARIPHPLEHHASYRAVVAAAAPIAALTSALTLTPPTRDRADTPDLAAALAIACGDLALGFAAPPGSRARVKAHCRAWVAVRELDRAVQRVAERRAAAVDTIARARRAVDRADVMVGSLPGVAAS